jgi:hypothetical protein
MRLNEEIRRLILDNRSTGEIREVAKRSGLRSLSEDGWRLVAQGVTTVDEVLRVTKDEQAILTNGYIPAPSNGEVVLQEGTG